MKFSHLRVTPWEPTFTWVFSAREAADRINSFHEDYPQRVEATESALADLWHKLDLTGGPNMWPLGYRILNSRLLEIHLRVFPDKSFAGKWRMVRVVVGGHQPPSPADVPGLMRNLEDAYRIVDLASLAGWYDDFETIHPFQDGNGRVGGIVVAAYAHHFHSKWGWLAPDQ